MANTNHGLTVYSHRVVDPSQRLQRPARGDITNCFNDAITVTTYDDVLTTSATRASTSDVVRTPRWWPCTAGR